MPTRRWRVGIEEVGHLVGVAGHDDDDPVPAVLDQLDDRVDGLASEVGVGASGQRVGLVDEQHTLVGLVEHGRDPSRGLADVAGHERGSVRLDEMATLNHPERAVDLGEEPGDRGLAGARVAGEDQVPTRLDHGQLAVTADPLHLQQVGHEPHLPLDLGQPDEVVELGQEVVEWSRGSAGIDGCGGVGRGRRTIGRGRVRGRHGLDGLDLREKERPVGIESEQLVAPGVGVERGHHVGQGHGVGVVGRGQVGSFTPVDADEDLEEIGCRQGPLLAAVGGVHPAQVGGGGLGEVGAHLGAEGVDEGPELVVGR
jgi:hypothetical protein